MANAEANQHVLELLGGSTMRSSPRLIEFRQFRQDFVGWRLVLDPQVVAATCMAIDQILQLIDECLQFDPILVIGLDIRFRHINLLLGVFEGYEPATLRRPRSRYQGHSRSGGRERCRTSRRAGYRRAKGRAATCFRFRGEAV
jgi:hypothetical protein